MSKGKVKVFIIRYDTPKVAEEFVNHEGKIYETFHERIDNGDYREDYARFPEVLKYRVDTLTNSKESIVRFMTTTHKRLSSELALELAFTIDEIMEVKHEDDLIVSVLDSTDLNTAM